ncbi:MAG TPA: hypothetical protein VNJ01_03285 [Bacteriovoracaceae bacterium]|nr:hypothetical protein [Bacteriovoracaceae bacterium]
MIKNFLSKENYGERVRQVLIFVAHIVLLKWILYTLYQGGVLPFWTLLFHFLGISLYGALLIRICAFIYKRQYEKELQKHAQQSRLDP